MDTALQGMAGSIVVLAMPWEFKLRLHLTLFSLRASGLVTVGSLEKP